MKYIKSYENINWSEIKKNYKRPIYFTPEQQRYLKNLARRIEYNINKYLGDNFVSCGADINNEKLPILVSYYKWIYNQDKGMIYADDYKLNMVIKSLNKSAAITNNSGSSLSFPDRCYHFSLQQAENLLSDAKLKFINYELDDTTKSYNL